MSRSRSSFIPVAVASASAAVNLSVKHNKMKVNSLPSNTHYKQQTIASRQISWKCNVQTNKRTTESHSRKRFCVKIIKHHFLKYFKLSHRCPTTFRGVNSNGYFNAVLWKYFCGNSSLCSNKQLWSSHYTRCILTDDISRDQWLRLCSLTSVQGGQTLQWCWKQM